MRKNEINELERIVEPLLAWYDAHARVLPWREEPTAYRVWVSEIMLQQTRVEAVKPYYERFLKALPDVEALANAEEEVLLKLWEGLGYYNRVRNLNKAARQIMEQYAGRIPDTYEELCKLSGIGSYTAGAIASIAFGRAVPAVDGNVLRVLARVRMDDRDIMQQKVKSAVEQELLQVMPEGRAGDFNQALMELGAMVCIPNGEPKCSECPWYGFCKARLAGCMNEYPKKTKKKPRTIEYKTVLVLQDANKTALQKRPAKGLLAGMYEFPWIEGTRSEEEVLAYLKELGLRAIRIRQLGDSKHIFTHKEWHMTGYAIRVDELDTSFDKSRFIFADKEEVEKQYAIPSAYAAYLQAARRDILL
ncbi:MAG: A/G-specific adenine glycosylase [Lachnospiraceae bacterium]|nr:A/G-specific adenine glycosylase [Lachnospiraceae bacterium]